MATYTTKSGDMWDAIAYTQLGSVDQTGALLRANMRYAHLYTFPAGVELTLPEIKESTSSDLPPWKKVQDEQH